MRVLIADDDPISRRLLASTLQQLGHETVVVADGRAAYDALVAHGAPRLAILDWEMPAMDGLAVCQAIRARSAPYVYVMLLTSRARREDMMAGFGAQVDDFLTKPCDALELQARLQAGTRILDLQERLLTAQAALIHEATHDPLTMLWNRRMVLDHLARELANAQGRGCPLTIALADVDHFKAINDGYGHDTGDCVLREVAARMQRALRNTDAIGRYGGEEFLLVLSSSGVRHDQDVGVVLERIRASVRQTDVETAAGSFPVTISIGVTTLMPDGEEPSAAIASADAALYRAKAEGRNCIRVTARRRDLRQDPSVITPRRSVYSTMSV